MKLPTYNTCTEACKQLDTSCPNSDCRNWIDYEDDLNCVSIAVEKHGALTLREIAKRLDCSFVRVKQIEDNVLEKIKNDLEDDNYL